jgi:hypothetical protein
MPSHAQPCASNPDAKALFGACSAPSAALWEEDPRLRNAVLLRLARKASRPGCSSRLRVALLESVLFCSVLCAGRWRGRRISAVGRISKRRKEVWKGAEGLRSPPARLPRLPCRVSRYQTSKVSVARVDGTSRIPLTPSIEPHLILHLSTNLPSNLPSTSVCQTPEIALPLSSGLVTHHLRILGHLTTPCSDQHCADTHKTSTTVPQSSITFTESRNCPALSLTGLSSDAGLLRGGLDQARGSRCFDPFYQPAHQNKRLSIPHNGWGSIVGSRAERPRTTNS